MKKHQYWQMIRGICILAVIMIHCPQGVSSLSKIVWLVIRQIEGVKNLVSLESKSF